MHANSHYSQDVPSIRPPSERPMQDPYRNLPDQLAISVIRTIFVALRVGAKYSGNGPFNRILSLPFVICVEIQTCSYWTPLEGVQTLPSLPPSLPQHSFLPVLHWFPRSLYGHPFHPTTHAVIQILTDLVNNICCYYLCKSILGNTGWVRQRVNKLVRNLQRIWDLSGSVCFPYSLIVIEP